MSELFRQDGINSRSVSARINQEEFRIDTQDMGPATEEVWGDADYEYWTTVPREAWGDLLMALTKEFLSGDANATDKLLEICKKHNVKHKWEQWI
jgi:hypothetical protein